MFLVAVENFDLLLTEVILAVFIYELQTMLGKSGPEIVQRCAFTHVHIPVKNSLNLKLSVSWWYKRKHCRGFKVNGIHHLDHEYLYKIHPVVVD